MDTAEPGNSEQGRVVVVTGASGGIGRATARAFGARGDRVALLARGQAGLDAAAAEIQRSGGAALTLPTDVADFEQVARAADRVEQEWGRIDIWVNCAFSSVFAKFTDITPDEYRRVTEVTYLGYVHGTHVALQHMRRHGSGVVIQVGSALGERAIPLQSAYCGSKHAINGFTSSVRTELLHEHSPINITVVQMPAVNTPQFSWVRNKLRRHPQPVPPIYQPEMAAGAVLFAADHPRRKQFWVGTSTALTVLANRLAPAVLDRYLARTGFKSQQTDQADPDQNRANLWHPKDAEPGDDQGAHGAFDSQAHSSDPQLLLSRHPGWAAGTAAAMGAAALWAWRH